MDRFGFESHDYDYITKYKNKFLKYMNKTEWSDSMNIKIKYFEGAKKLEINPKGNLIDVYSREDIFIPQFDMRLVHLGFAMELPKGKIAKLYPRSSTFKTWGCILANSVGIIDETYCGDNDEWLAPLVCIAPKNSEPVPINELCSETIFGTWVRKGDKIAQFEIVDAMEMPTFVEVETLGNKDRHGIGSTGTK